jgi:hypothetical protein
MQQHSSNTNNSNGRSAAVAAAAAGSPKLQAAWQQLQQERPDVFYCVDERHVDFISKQSKEEQLKVRCSLCLVQSFLSACLAASFMHVHLAASALALSQTFSAALPACC